MLHQPPITLTLFIISPLLFLISAAQARNCNGHAELCGRRYSNISFVGAHDSPFVGPLPSDNQGISVTEQLQRGYRFLQGQTHIDDYDDENPGVLHMCHTDCLLRDAGTVTEYLATVKTFLDNNPDEVVTVLLTNGDDVDISVFDSVVTESGIKDYAFTPSGKLSMDQWPTLEELINSNKRLVLFLDYGADTSKVPYILPEFDYIFETKYGITDPNFPDCSLDRPPGASPDGLMFLMNHFLDIKIIDGILVPDRANAERTNAANGEGSIGAQVETCWQLYQRPPNFVLLDFVEKGEGLLAQDQLNAL